MTSAHSSQTFLQTFLTPIITIDIIIYSSRHPPFPRHFIPFHYSSFIAFLILEETLIELQVKDDKQLGNNMIEIFKLSNPSFKSML